MQTSTLGPAARALLLLVAATALGRLTPAVGGEHEQPLPAHYTGLLNDYTPSAAVVKNGPYEMRGKWALDVDWRRNTAHFSAAMNMETSDFGIAQGTVNKDDPTTRGAHTHHLSMLDGVLSHDWSSCPGFNPPVTDGFVITGTAFVTGNGGPAPFGNPSPLKICVLGGENVGFSNITLMFGLPASSHFGTQAIHGVVANCRGPLELQSSDCLVHD
jgi:hypothetical protein